MMTNNIGKYIDKKALLIQNGFPCGNWNENGIGILQLRPFNVSNLGLIDLNQKKYIEIEKNIKTYQVRYDDIIFTNTNSEILVGRTALWKSNENCVLSNHMSIIRVLNKEKLSPSFLAHFLHYQWISGFSKSICRRHVNQASIGIDKLKAIELPEYPIFEQRKIAHVLSTVQKAIEQQDNLIRTTTELKKALMQKLFTEGTRGEPQKETEIGLVPESWEVESINQTKTLMQYGTSVKCDYETKGVPVIRIPNIIGGKIDLSDLKFGKPKADELEKLKLDKDDLIFVRTNGAKELSGRCAIFKNEIDNCYYASYLIRLKLDTNKVIPDFLNYYTQTELGKSFLNGKAIRTADGKYNINTGILNNVLFPLPKLNEQEEIVKAISLMEEKITLQNKKKQTLTALFKTLLHELMTGQRRVHELEFDAFVTDSTLKGAKRDKRK